jgi:hypothetical protein
MPPTNANPGAGNARVHGISKSDAASPTRNQPPAQTNPAARSADDERAGAVAAFLLAAASALNVKVGFYGDKIVTIERTRVPDDLIRQLHAEQNRQAIIKHIRRENGGGAS